MLVYNYFSNWVKEKALSKANLKKIVKFIKKDIVYRYKVFSKLIIDKKLENKRFVKTLTKLYSINKIVVLVYYLQTNRIIKQGYKPIIDILAKLIKEKNKD